MANTSLLKPTSVEVALSENNPNRAVITLEPFERGYGHTLGNALRRILTNTPRSTAFSKTSLTSFSTSRVLSSSLTAATKSPSCSARTAKAL